MNDIYDLARQDQHLIAEAERLRRRLQQALEELEEIRHQAERQRRESCLRRIDELLPLSERNSGQKQNSVRT